MPQFRFGKHPPKRDYRTLLLKKYLLNSLPPPADAVDVLPRVYENLGVSDPGQLFPMDGNDTIGDCTIAAVAHAITVFSGLTGTSNIMDRQDVIKLYYQLTGGIDSGLDELKVLNYWQSNVVSSDEILAFASIDHRNHDHIKQAIGLFGGVYLGFQVQEGAINQFNSGQPWVPTTPTPDGHAVYAVAYNPDGLTMLTWGSTQKGTWDWWDECVDEAYAILPPEAQLPDFNPGFDIDQLRSDLDAVAG